MGKTVTFVPDKKGIREISKSDGMCSELLDHAIEIAEAASADASRFTGQLSIKGFEKPPYAAAVDKLTHTAVGVAHTCHRLSGYNELKHKSLSKQLYYGFGVFK